MEQLRDAAVADLASSWGTSPFADSSLCAPGMALVRLPVGGAIPAEATSADAKASFSSTRSIDLSACHGWASLVRWVPSV